MRLLKKFGGVDLYKRVEKAPDAITLIQAGKKTPLLFTSGGPISMTRCGLKHLPGTITRLAEGGRGTLGGG
jgi:hypothetical protein